MPISPIDLQTSLNQMHEVGRHEHAKITAITEQQQFLDKEAVDKANLKNERLEEAKKGEGSIIRNEHDAKKESSSEYRPEHKKGSEKDEEEKELSHDDRMGRFIDVLK